METTRDLKVLICRYRLSEIRGDKSEMQRIRLELVEPRPALEASLEPSEMGLLRYLRGNDNVPREKRLNEPTLLPDVSTLQASPLDQRQERIKSFVRSRGIRYLFHFTQATDVASILERGLLSRAAMDYMNIPYSPTDDHRRDGHKDASCLSISFPNFKMFSRKRNNLDYSGLWAVLKIDPAVLWELDCAFYFTNASNTCFQTVPLPQLKSFVALRGMFEDTIHCQRSAINDIRDHWTTDPQAEVLVFERIPPRYIKRAILEEPESDRLYLGIWGPERYEVSRTYFKWRS